MEYLECWIDSHSSDNIYRLLCLGLNCTCGENLKGDFWNNYIFAAHCILTKFLHQISHKRRIELLIVWVWNFQACIVKRLFMSSSKFYASSIWRWRYFFHAFSRTFHNKNLSWEYFVAWLWYILWIVSKLKISRNQK